MLRIFGFFRAVAINRRRLLCAVLLAVYIVTAAGIPLPAGIDSQASLELYPCAKSKCGCASAEHCWRSCCCHTLAERIAWAREHGVRPPDFAIAAARQSGLDLAWLENRGDGPHAESCSEACCGTGATSEPATSRKSIAACCENVPRSCCATVKSQQQRSSDTDNIVAWRALRCHGHSLNWLAAVPTLIIVRPGLSLDRPIFAWLGPTTSEGADGLSVHPDVPPPERA
jgi:hypothetical protein